MKTLRLLFGLALVATAFSVQAEDYSEKQHDKLIRECNRNNLESCVTAAIWMRDYLEAPAHAYPFLKKACSCVSVSEKSLRWRQYARLQCFG